MANYDVTHANLKIIPVGSAGEFKVYGDLDMTAANCPFSIQVRVKGEGIDDLTATRIIGGALAEIAASVNHAAATFNINSTSVKATFGTLT